VDQPKPRELILTPNVCCYVNMFLECENSVNTGESVLMHELQKSYRWDIIGVSEMHWMEVDDIKVSGFRMLSSG
jgi:hypothetical protein